MMHPGVLTLAQDDAAAMATGLGFCALWIALLVLMIASMWVVFTKAGQPGWGAIIPFYNVYLMCKIAGRPGWWLILFLIPIVSFIVAIIVALDIAKSFGKSALFAVGMLLLPIVFYPILAWGSAEYQGPAAAN
jgi:hypothetical protein